MLKRRISKLFRAMAGQALGEREVDHAEGLLQVEREELHEQVAQFNRGLAHHAALCVRLETELTRLRKGARSLEARVRGALEAGDRDGAGRLALQLEELGERADQRAAQLEKAEATYEELVRERSCAVDAARARIEALKETIGECRTQTALAELAELSAGLHGAIGMADGDFEQLRRRIEDRRDEAAGRIRVARDAVDRSELRASEAERTALAAGALERFERSMSPIGV